MIRIVIVFFSIMFISGEAAPIMASPPQTHVVEIQAFSFHPQRTAVAQGDTIVWINRDIVPHTVTANGGIWESQKLEEGQSLEVVVEHGGVYSYFCEFHPHMTGVLTAR